MIFSIENNETTAYLTLRMELDSIQCFGEKGTAIPLK